MKLHRRSALSGALLALSLGASGVGCGDDIGPMQMDGSVDLHMTGGDLATGPSPGPMSITSMASGTAFTTPLDAVPTSDGKTIYFSAQDPSGNAAIFSLAATGQATPASVVSMGIVYPGSLALSSDDKTLYVADTGAARSSGEGNLFAITIAGGGTTAIGSLDANLVPTALALSADDQTLYVAGALNGAPSLLKVPVAGGAGTAIAITGATLVDPFGVAVGKDGTAYVVDTSGDGDNSANVVKIAPGGAATVLAKGLRVNVPSGIALSRDEAFVLVSAYDRALGAGELLQIPTSGATAPTPYTFKNGTTYPQQEPYGLHRASQADVFSLVEAQVSATSGDGTIYLVK